jgi:hypothetical protein
VVTTKTKTPKKQKVGCWFGDLANTKTPTPILGVREKAKTCTKTKTKINTHIFQSY